MYRLIFFFAFAASVAWMVASPGYEPFIGVLFSIGGLLRDELHGIVGARILSLTPRRGVVKNLSNTRYSFTGDQLVNPLIVADLVGWLSDSGDQIVAVNVAASNKSNRYFADDINISDDVPDPIVTAKRGDSTFSYQYLGASLTGIHLLRTWECGGGSGVFGNIVLITISVEPAVNVSTSGAEKVNRFVVKKVAAIPLGDRYDGRVSYRLGILSIGPCQGLSALRESRQRLLIL